MVESRPSESLEKDENSVPQIIDDDCFNTVRLKTETLIKDLREHEQYQLAREFIRLFSLTENLFLNLKDEQASSRVLVEQHVDATGRIEEAVKISQKDHDVIENLRKEVTDAWKLSDVSKSRGNC